MKLSRSSRQLFNQNDCGILQIIHQVLRAIFVYPDRNRIVISMRQIARVVEVIGFGNFPVPCGGNPLGETPESIVGTWQFDSVRTISEHVDRVAKARSDVIDHDQVEAMKAGLAARAEAADRQVSMTITEDTIMSTNPNSGTTSAPYTVIGGNSRLFVIESTDDEGYAWVMNIRLVEGGIAIETTDPETRPEQWERERRRAMEQMTKSHIDALRGSSDPVTDMVIVDNALGGAASLPTRDTESRIRLVYFRAATAE